MSRGPSGPRYPQMSSNIKSIGSTLKKVVQWPGKQIEKEVKGQSAMDRVYQKQGKMLNSQQSGPMSNKKEGSVTKALTKFK